MIGYWIELTRDDNDALLVTCPAFPEVTSFGDDVRDAIEHARPGLDLHARVAEKENIGIRGVDQSLNSR